MKQLDAVVIGGSLGGLVCAVRLAMTGQNVLILEAAPAVGGSLRTQAFNLNRSAIKQLDQLHLPPATDSQQVIDQLTKRIEQNQGEIVTDTPVTALDYDSKKHSCQLTSAWGDIWTDCVVLGVSVAAAKNLLTDQVAEKLFTASAPPLFLATKAKPFGIYMVATEANILGGRAITSFIKSGLAVANDILSA